MLWQALDFRHSFSIQPTPVTHPEIPGDIFVGIQRREAITLLLAGIAASMGPAGAAAAPHPVLWRVRKNGAQTFIFGFSDAKDQSWLTPLVRRAFDESSEIWFEAPQTDPAAPPPQNSVSAAPPGNSPPPGYSERSLFDVLKPDLSARLLAAAERYGVTREKLEHVQPWRAYFVLNSGYLARTNASRAEIENFADIVLSRLAYASRKQVKSEFATSGDIMGYFMGMSEKEASERIGFLVDFLEEDEAGGRADRYDWIEGRNNTRVIDGMRTRWPALYQSEQVSRNVEWAKRIEQFLESGGGRFVVVGLQHTLGPDSIPVQLRARGLEPEAI